MSGEPGASKQQEKRGDDGKFLPGQSGNPGGRPPGSKNKFTNLKDAYLWVFEELGGQEALFSWVQKSERNKAMYYQWLTKMLPSAVEGDVKADVKVVVERIITDKRPDE